MSGPEDRRNAAATLRVGARAFVSKNPERSLIVSTIRRALSGDLLKPEWVRTSHSNVFTEEITFPLNQQQIEIPPLLASGCTNQEIATQVGLTEITVKQNITVIFRALGIENRA